MYDTGSLVGRVMLIKQESEGLVQVRKGMTDGI